MISVDNSQITHQQNALYFHFLFFNPYTCFSLYKTIFRGLVVYIYFTSIVYVCKGKGKATPLQA
jgi:hypothetical protein